MRSTMMSNAKPMILMYMFMLGVECEQSEGDETHHQCGRQHHRHNEEQHIFFADGTDFEVMCNVFDHVYIMAELC